MFWLYFHTACALLLIFLKYYTVFVYLLFYKILNMFVMLLLLLLKHLLAFKESHHLDFCCVI